MERFITVTIVVFVNAQNALAQCETSILNSPQVQASAGWRVDVNGDWAVVGAPQADDFSGAAYLYREEAGDWLLTDVLRLPEPPANPPATFGRSVAIDGDRLVVGAPFSSVANPNQGSVYVFRYEPRIKAWEIEQQLRAAEVDAGDNFGIAVSIDSDLILVGAQRDSVDGVEQAGAAYVFRLRGGVWVQEVRLVHPDPSNGDQFGASVSIDDSRALVGASADDAMGSNAGAAFLYVFQDSQWSLVQRITAFDTSTADRFGFSVALHQGYLLIGAPQVDGQNGAAYVYSESENGWRFVSKLVATNPAGPFPFLGSSVALNGEELVAIAGAPCDFALGFESGAVHVFQGNEKQWTETAKLTASDGGPQDCFGISVALDGDTGFIGAPFPSEDPGTAYSFIGFGRLDCNANGLPDSCDVFVGAADDKNENGIPDECEAVGDLNGDGTVGIVDFLMLLALWGPCSEPCPPSCLGDIDGNCVVDVLDFANLLFYWTA